MQILNTTVQGDVTAAVSPIVGPLWGEQGESDPTAATIAWLSWSFGLLLLGAALSRLLSAWYAEGELTVGEVLRDLRPRLPALVLAWLVALAAKVASLATLGLATPFVAALFVMIAPVIAIERVGAGAAIRRSFSLARRRIWFVAMMIIGVAITETVLQFTLTGLPWMVATALLPDVVATWVVAAAAVAARIVTASAAAAAPALIYLDARIRAEGLDLQLATADALPAGRESRLAPDLAVRPGDGPPAPTPPGDLLGGPR